MKSSALLASVAFLAGCAAVTEEQIEAREYRDFEWRSKFFAYKADCRSKGGMIIVHGTTGKFSSDGAPAYGDLYRCQK
ncbi:MAG: hypothetical protein OEW68_06280 [Gammaproteobacteria bacterium]|nr:hypothetical protein [Gammaproteobacteria bacterium]MDH4314432.1 hypothetical protein [Gammaproteobacteria bacterium]MDH5213281.1 hypothetical protein [Gammaproteobacteria bacterium]MDH5499554.1 hypothetical protein [Gammaproteobacteria bacterium]